MGAWRWMRAACPDWGPSGHACASTAPAGNCRIPVLTHTVSALVRTVIGLSGGATGAAAGAMPTTPTPTGSNACDAQLSLVRDTAIKELLRFYSDRGDVQVG
jgi:hypothetical protein